MFFGHFPLAADFTGSVLGVPGEGLPGGKSGFRLGGVAKSIKTAKIDRKTLKLRPERPQEIKKKQNPPKSMIFFFFLNSVGFLTIFFDFLVIFEPQKGSPNR